MIVVKLMGGLGNQMFQYALGRHLAEIHKTTLMLDLTFLQDKTPRENFVFRNYELDIFNIQQNFAAPSDLKDFFQKTSGINKLLKKILNKIIPVEIKKESYFHYDPQVLKGPKTVYLEGYWQSEKYFKAIEGILRKEFTFRCDIDSRFKELADKIQSTNSVCVHVRRTDFLSNSYHAVCEMDYYTRAEQIIVSKLPSPHLFIFSDDIEWCINNLKLNVASTFVRESFNDKDISHCLHLMTRCKHYVISNSSFSWWAAWLNSEPQKLVVAPEKWFNDRSVNTEDLIPDTWLRI
jgi:hypothetical protein